MKIPSSLKLIRVFGPVKSQKNGRDYCFAYAETPSEGASAWSSIRWRCVSERLAFPTAWKVGAEVPVEIVEFKARDGEGVFDVPSSR